MRDHWWLLIRSQISVLMVLLGRVRVVEGAYRMPRAIALDQQHDCVFHGMSARALNDNLHITSQFASPRPILGHGPDDSKPTGERRGEGPGMYPCLLIGISKRPINHLNLPLIRRIVGVPLGRGDIAVAHPLLKGPHRHTGGGHRRPERVA